MTNIVLNSQDTQAIFNAVSNKEATLKELKVMFPTVIGEAKTFKEAKTMAEEFHAKTVGEEMASNANENAYTSLREQAAIEVPKMLEEKGKLTFAIASIIDELKGDFDNSNEFLAFCKDKLGLGKASVYNYLKLHGTFGSKPEFSKVATRVLNELSRYKNLKDIIDEAEVLALDGKLDTKAAMKLIDDNELKLNPPATEQEDEPEIPEQSTKNESETDLPDDTDLPWKESDEEPETPSNTVVQPTVAPEKSNTLDKEDDTAELHKQIERLLEQLETANKTIANMQATSNRDVKVASAPMLPQFSNACYYARLGLSQSESSDKSRVKKAFRELVKLGYGEGHEAFPRLKEAMESLIG